MQPQGCNKVLNWLLLQASPGFAFSALPFVHTWVEEIVTEAHKKSSSHIQIVLQHKNKGIFTDEKEHAPKEFEKQFSWQMSGVEDFQSWEVIKAKCGRAQCLRDQ